METPKKVVLALIEKNGEFLLIERLVPQRKLVWAFPGGVIEEGESDETAVIREAKEEVGLDVVVVEKILERKHPETYVNLVYFHCRPVDGLEHLAVGQPDEIKAVAWIPAQRVLDYFTSDVHPVIKEFIGSKSNQKEAA